MLQQIGSIEANKRAAAILVLLAFVALIALPQSAWASYSASNVANNNFHVDKRPLLIDVDVEVPDDYVVTTETIDPSVFTPTAVFKHEYEEPLTSDDITISPKTIPEGTKGNVTVTVSYTRDGVTVTKEVEVAADVPVATLPASSLGVGSKVKFGNNGSITWTVIDKNHSGNPGNSLSLMAFSYGHRPMATSIYYNQQNLWENSEMCTWLNSTSGFLSGWTDAERNALLTTSLRTYTNGGNLSGIRWSSHKVYILDGKEFGVGNGVVEADNTKYAFFADWTHMRDLTNYLGNNYQWVRTGSMLSSGAQKYLHFHTGTYPQIMNSNNYGRDSSVPYYSPVINISQNQLVRAKRDASGCYVVYFE